MRKYEFLALLQVFDFIDNVPVLLEKLCGKEPPKLFHSSNNRLKVRKPIAISLWFYGVVLQQTPP